MSPASKLPPTYWIVLALSVGTSSMAAPPPAWIPAGTPIAATALLEFSPNIVADGMGGALLAWTRYDTVRANFAIGIDADGHPRPGWPTEGLRLDASDGWDPFMSTDGGGGAFVVSTTLGTTSFQHVLPPTARGVPDPGSPAQVARTEPQSDPGSPISPAEVMHNGHMLAVVCPDGVGGAFVSYTDDQRFLAEGYVRRYAPDGTFSEVSLTGISGCLPNQCYTANTAICPDGAGGVLVALSHRCGARVARLTPELTMALGWPSTGALAESCPMSSPYVGICSDGAGGGYVVWQGYPVNGPHYISVQHVGADGLAAPGWPDTVGIVLSPHPTMPGYARPYYGASCSVVPDGSGGALIAWSDQRTDEGDIYVQRVLADRTIAPGWPLHGRAAGVASGTQSSPVVVADGHGGALVAWQDERDVPDFGIYANHVDAMGAIDAAAPSGGFPIGAGSGLRMVPRIATDGDGGAFIAWVDYRSGNGDLYASHFTPDASVPTLPALAAVDATPEAVHLWWNLGGETPAETWIERRSTESEFARIAGADFDGTGIVSFTDREVVAGQVYAYRLGYRIGAETIRSAEAWVTVPTRTGLALEAIRPNPSRGSITCRLTLTGSEEASVDLVDVAGRGWVHRPVGTLGRGTHEVALSLPATAPAGVFFVRLSRAGESHTLRLSLVR